MNFLRELFEPGQEAEPAKAEQPLQVEIFSPRHPAEAVLESREVYEKNVLEGGSNKIELIHLNDDGSGVFKPKEGEQFNQKKRGTGFQRERAAYLVDLLLGFNLVPPTVIREIEGKIGSIQQFVPDSNAWYEVPIEQRKSDEILRQLQTMKLFDFIIANNDRHGGNFLVDKNDKLWAIDHGDTFHERRLPPFFLAALYDSEIVAKIKSFAQSETKKNLLRSLLRELLPEEETGACIKRIELLADNFDGDQPTKQSIQNIDVVSG